ncbi:MAG: NADH-quinone oxidoreductase subunit NuoF [Synergistaceae bacterium]|jgi:NADH-quinone oxidoreductase subunit F/NADP-reducing hydrogenase subunit HndC|nr:NADH-quinone oxidoreductase subunit NuoF [Synergistaceae bacterium]MDD3319590.1 NADH-quinone oxidoreductase subunit NuoF [Synergistaceae bacterium]MDD3963760.1 NADH-quinone oxidoreductase subunit NuoF [Synergistaceae bacterium]MDD4704908.1 NADH-quinone oxidoreductase subunit NuoF [Synergistaceae bacterium]MDD5420525.1 NADH-quinone oxidoreductase subunit NuoF [Synergistaceae bacterium]
MATFRSHVLVCGGTGCTSGGSDKVLETLREGIKANGLDKEITVVQTGCHGMCEAGPIVIVYPEGTFYTHVNPQDAKEIVAEHLLKGRVVERLLFKEAMHSEAVPHYNELPFYSKQVRLTLRNCGYIDPDSLEEYIARDGYQALAKVLTEKTPEQVVEDIKASGLRGRGGGGFSTGMKWMFCAKSPGPKKYVICNADEGDPGAFMDRSLLEGDPHAIIEGMAIGAYAMGADEGYIYCRAEYPLAIKRLLKSIEDAEDAGLLGENILGTGFNFTLHVKEGAGAFVCGEETALMNSIEGKRGMPRPRPPFPAVKGLWEKPSNINNVETWANVAQIMFHGPEWYANYGYEKSRGTKVFALTGKVNNTGLVEVPMGTTIREVVFDIGGGIIGGKKFKAVQIGGPSGGCLTEEHLDLPISYESLTAAGAIMGSGGLVVVDEDTCMVDMARFFLEFTQRESCGKCIPCREGTKKMLDILIRITEGKGREEDIENLIYLGTQIKTASLCGLGQTAPNPVLTTLRYFRHEYEAHIREKRCPAGACKALITIKIDPAKCVGCTKCTKACPVNAIAGTVKQPHVIDQDKCIKCGACVEVCPFKAIDKK